MSLPPLHGIIPPLVTPLTPQLDLDAHSLEKMLEHVIAGGVHGIFLLGSTGEGPSLSEGMRKEVNRVSLKVVSGRIPVLTNISSSSFQETMHMAESAAREGASFAVLSPAFYYKMNPGELLRYYRFTADRSPIPLLIYNTPLYTRTSLEPELIRELSFHQNIAGIKDSSGNLAYIHELIKIRRDASFPILIGPEMLLVESLLLGCDGGICGGANLYPELYVQLYRSAVERNMEELDRFQGLIRKIQNRLYGVPDSPMGIVIGLKYLLWKRGLCPAQMAMPVYEALSSEQINILETLDNEIKHI